MAFEIKAFIRWSKFELEVNELVTLFIIITSLKDKSVLILVLIFSLCISQY